MRICCESSFQWHAIICFTVFVLFVIHIHTSVHVISSLSMYLFILLFMYSMCIFSQLFYLFIIFTFTHFISCLYYYSVLIWPIFLGKVYMKSLPELKPAMFSHVFRKLFCPDVPKQDTMCLSSSFSFCMLLGRGHALSTTPTILVKISVNAHGMTPHSLLLLEPGRPSGLYMASSQ